MNVLKIGSGRTASLAAVCLLAFATSASAEEPTGWREWPWGTPMVTMVKDDSWCRGSVKEDRDKKTAICGYQYVGDVYISPLILDFEPDDGLNGYSMGFESNSYTKMRSVAVERFGLPASTATKQYRTGGGQSVSGEALMWHWPSGTVASLTELCGRLGLSCLTVSTKALADSRRKKEEEKKEDRKKGL